MADAAVGVDAGASSVDGSASEADGSSPVAADAGLDARAESDSSASVDATVVEPVDAGELDDGASRPGEDAGLPPQSPTAMYRVQTYIGGLDHLIIQKQDGPRGYCVTVRIASPGDSPRDAVNLPRGWALEGILALESGSCELPSGSSESLIHYPSKAEGRIVFREVTASGQVCSLDLDIALTFEADAGRVPQREHLFAMQLAVPCAR